MFLSKFLVKHKYENEKFYQAENADRKDVVFNRKTINDTMVAACNRLTKKSDYGENMEALTEEEQIFFIVTEVECEVNNSGFERFLYESSGKFACKAVESLKIVGAENMAFFCDKALNAIGKELPEDHEERGNILKEAINDEVREIFAECEKAFEGDPDDFNAIIYKYLTENSGKFTE